MINLYTEITHSDETSWLNHLIHPIRAYWGDGTKEWSKWSDDFLFYKDYFKIVENTIESDVGFLPLTLNYYVKNNKLSLVDNMADLMEKNNQSLYVWVDGDLSINYYHANCIFIKYFGDSTMQLKNEIIQPGDMKKDLLYEYYGGRLKKREKSDFPVIGFDGIANYPNSKLIGTILKNSLHHASYKLLNEKIKPEPIFPFLLKRKRILAQLKKSNNLKTNFKIRSSFAPGTLGRDDQARKEFITNIIDSDYTFCFRGAANYSLRFYETLCLGRIPLFINSNCILPFQDKVDWKNIICWVDEDHIDHLVEKIQDYHQSMTNHQFIERQEYCREIWENYLSKEGFLKYFHDSIKQSIKSSISL